MSFLCFAPKTHRALIPLLFASESDSLALDSDSGPPLCGVFVLFRENIDLNRPLQKRKT